jgi:3-methyladenine DNA glycosylase AlkD
MIRKYNLKSLLKDLMQKANPKKAKLLARFFKTGKGEYGEGDLFLGITVPESRKIAVKYSELPFSDISKLIKNKYHEARLIALLILVHQYRSCARPALAQRKIFEFYLAHTKYINNWDLVDLSAGYIVGNYLYNKKKNILLKLAKSKNIWERRIAIISTFAFIYKGESKWTFHIVKMLLSDSHDLIHKACGWMLREVGKRVSEKDLTLFLDTYSYQMPRTMLRYAIERLPENKRRYYLKS